MEEMSEVGGRKEWGIFAISRCTTLPRLHVYHPGSSSDPIHLSFYGDFIIQAWLINSLAIGD